ncbi:hypothetical protein [Nocardia sp. bgisy118]|uniref:hypothetical protein n=1 Tax=Nocardia sp. bgisy118 TaxID=3413786 RepID=UPI003F4A3FD4
MATEQYRARLIGSEGAEGAEGEVKVTRLTGADLDQTFVGKFLGRSDGGYNRLGKIMQLVPVVTDPNGLWLATIRWGETPEKPAETERRRITFSQQIEVVELSEG